MFRTRPLLLVIVFISSTLYAQDTTYLDNHWKETEKSIARYYRIISMPDSRWKIVLAFNFTWGQIDNNSTINT